MGLKGKLAEFMAEALEKKVDGETLIEGLEKVLDEKIGEKSSERIQRRDIMNLICEMQNGIYKENPLDLAKEYERRAKSIRDIYMEVED